MCLFVINIFFCILYVTNFFFWEFFWLFRFLVIFMFFFENFFEMAFVFCMFFSLFFCIIFCFCFLRFLGCFVRGIAVECMFLFLFWDFVEWEDCLCFFVEVLVLEEVILFLFLVEDFLLLFGILFSLFECIEGVLFCEYKYMEFIRIFINIVVNLDIVKIIFTVFLFFWFCNFGGNSVLLK